MQKSHLYCVILNLVRIMILRQRFVITPPQPFSRVTGEIMGTLMISIIFALFVNEGIKYLAKFGGRCTTSE